MNLKCADVLIIGGGAAGLRAAISAVEAGVQPVVIAAGPGASILATADYTACGDHLQMCGYSGNNDSPNEFAEDIRKDSFNLGNEARIKVYSKEAGYRLQELLAWRVKPILQLGPRSLLIPGLEIINCLRKRLLDSKVPIVGSWKVLGLLQKDNRVIGVIAVNPSGVIKRIGAGAVVLATGGYHSIYGFTTGGSDSFHLAQAWTLRAGGKLIDLEAINFCPHVVPTGTTTGSIFPYLISQITPVRLTDAQGHDLSEVVASQPSDSERDKLNVTLAMARSVKNGDAFPNGEFNFQVDWQKLVSNPLFNVLYGSGIVDSETQLSLLQTLESGKTIRVRFAAHYSAGGVLAAENGSTGIDGLFVCGEAAGGTFGAFRTASSITDALVFGQRAGQTASETIGDVFMPESLSQAIPTWNPKDVVLTLRQIITRSLGPLRIGADLEQAVQEITSMRMRCLGGENTQSHGAAADMLLVAEAALRAALLRKDSRGFHVRVENQSFDSTVNANTVVSLHGSTISADLVTVRRS